MTNRVIQPKCGPTLLLATCAFAILQSTGAATTDQCGSLGRLDAALRLTQALYPELGGKEIRIRISDGWLVGPEGSTDARSFRLTFENPSSSSTEVGSVGSSTENQEATPKEELPLNIQFQFDRTNPWNKGSICSPAGLMVLTRRDQLRAAEKFADQHPQWSDDELVSALKERGLRFGPRDQKALLAALPLKQLRRYYGALRVEEIKFVLLNQGQRQAVGTNFMELQWQINTVERHTNRQLAMNVDAYSGRILGLGEMEANKKAQ
jgi:hypothetical protein